MTLMTKLHRKHAQSHKHKPHLLYTIIVVSCILWFSLLFTTHFLSSPAAKSLPPPVECSGRYIYIHDIPAKFNVDILRDCTNFDPWTDLCSTIENSGLGRRLDNGFFSFLTGGKFFSDSCWYSTNQFSLELIFHNRMKQYRCLTNDSSRAAAIFVPFYVGLDISRYLWGYNISYRDAAGIELLTWLKSRPEWSVMNGRDHFFVSGRITWDFRRQTDGRKDWGSKFLFLPAAKNLTVLDIEASQWHSNEVAIPYPTYFHPSKDDEVFNWQERMRTRRRPWLYSFAGAGRPYMKNSIRGRIIEQCGRSKKCSLLSCEKKKVVKCHDPKNIMSLFQRSVFCLQPQGDSYTRRSIFDSMLAGCVPVFFHYGSAYEQYVWHLPKNYSRYSVFISEDEVRDGKVDIEEVLSKYSDEEVKSMREEVVRMIPRLVYADPRSRLETLKDAFDFAVEGMIDRVWEQRKYDEKSSQR